MDLFNLLAGKVDPSCTQPAQWVANRLLASGTSLSSDFEKALNVGVSREGGFVAKGGSFATARNLGDCRKHVLGVIAAIDAYHWLLKGLYARPAQVGRRLSLQPHAVVVTRYAASPIARCLAARVARISSVVGGSECLP